jgi:hypothetical protein
VRPDSAGPCTLPEALRFAWRTNAGAQPRLGAGAQRTLEGVGCSAWFGWARSVGLPMQCPPPRDAATMGVLSHAPATLPSRGPAHAYLITSSA